MKLTDQLGAWTPLLAPMLEKPWCKDLFAQVDAAYQAGDPPVYPPQEAVFTALRLTSPESVRCVILGQDPGIIDIGRSVVQRLGGVSCLADIEDGHQDDRALRILA